MRDSEKMNSKNPLTPEGEIEDHLKEISGQEQLYSIALFDILGFCSKEWNTGNFGFIQ